MGILQWFGWIVVSLLGLVGLLILRLKAPPVPSLRRSIENGLWAAQIRPGELVVDLGAGDGRVLQTARDKYQARVIGWELNPVAWLLAKARLGWRSDVRLTNFWKASIDQADVVFVFLMPHLMDRVEREIWGRMKPGARLISNSFPLPNRKPTTHQGSAYVYVR